MGEARFVHRPRPERLRLTVGRVVQQLEHQAVAHEIRRGHRERRIERHELRGALVGRVDLAFESESEQLAVEAFRSSEIGHALTDVIEGAHDCDSSTRSHRRCRSSLVRQRPVARSNCQWWRLHVSTPSSISPKRVRSACRCGQKRSIRHPSRSKNSSACSRRSRYERSTYEIRSDDNALKKVITNSLKFDGSGRWPTNRHERNSEFTQSSTWRSSKASISRRSTSAL